MSAYPIIAMALCVVCILFTLGLAKAASRESRASEQILGALNDGEPAVKLEFDGDTVTAAYVYGSNTTRTSGCVWKYDHTGPQFISTGFDGPYTQLQVEVPYENK